jgi:hypothetical protein
MTSGDDSASATAGKGSADLQGSLDAPEGLGRLPTELRSELHEPPPDLPFYLAPLNRLDLLDPDEEALALWIIDRLHSGDLIAYGRPYGTGQHQKSAVPTADWQQSSGRLIPPARCRRQC